MARGGAGFGNAACVGNPEFTVSQLAVEQCAMPIGCACHRERMYESREVVEALVYPHTHG